MAKPRQKMARPKILYRTKFKTKTRHIYSKLRSRHKTGHGKLDHATVILEGAGIGGLTSIGSTALMGTEKPNWLAPVISFFAGLGIGKMQTKKWGKALEEGLTAMGTAYATDRITTGEALLPSLQSIGQGGGIIGGVIY